MYRSTDWTSDLNTDWAVDHPERKNVNCCLKWLFFITKHFPFCFTKSACILVTLDSAKRTKKNKKKETKQSAQWKSF